MHPQRNKDTEFIIVVTAEFNKENDAARKRHTSNF